MASLRTASIVILLGLALTPGAARAQGTAPEGGAAVDADTRQFDELVRLAADRLERALLMGPDDEDAQQPLLMEAERYGRAAASLRPASPDGWFLTAAALGLRAHHESTRQQIRLGGEMWSLAATALERDPDHAGAHHVMGRLNFEVMSLSGFARMIATHLYGSEMLRRASWQQAEEHLRRAVRLEPDAIYHRLWLARLYVERGDDEEARRLLEQIATMPAAKPLDERLKEEAAEEWSEL